MFEAVVTFVTMDPTYGHVVTKVYRLEFESEQGFQRWLEIGADMTTNSEQLVAQT